MSSSSMASKDDTSFLELSQETKDFVSRYLHSIDEDDTGVISAEQLEDCLRIIGFFPTDEDIEWLITHFDANKNGKLEIQELVDNLHIINAHSLNKDEIVSAFKVFDRNGDGYIRCNELVKVLTYNNGFSTQEARSLTDYLIRTFDKNGDGKLDYGEFVEIFMSTRYPFITSEEVGKDKDSKDKSFEQMMKNEMKKT